MTLKALRQALLPILVGITITFSVVVSHNDALARDKQATHAITVSCKATNGGLTNLVATVNDLLAKSPDRVSINDKLVASVKSSYTECLSGVK